MSDVRDWMYGIRIVTIPDMPEGFLAMVGNGKFALYHASPSGKTIPVDDATGYRILAEMMEKRLTAAASGLVEQRVIHTETIEGTAELLWSEWRDDHPPHCFSAAVRVDPFRDHMPPGSDYLGIGPIHDWVYKRRHIPGTHGQRVRITLEFLAPASEEGA